MSFLICLFALFGLQTPAESQAEVLDQWLESIELDMPAAVVKDARARMASDATWSKNGRALALYSRALTATGGDAEAYELLSKAQVPTAEVPHIQLGLARLELLDDKLEALIRRLGTDDKENPVRFPAHADSWWLLGKAHARLGRTDRAAPYLQRFVQNWRLHPQAPAAWHQLSQLALAKRDMQAANKYREQGQNLSTWHGYYKARRMQVLRDPQDALPRYGLAQLWSSVQMFGRAAEEIDRCLILDVKFARGWALKGEIERKENRMSSALEAYTRALDLDGTLGDARFNRALIAMQLGNKDMAELDLTMIVDGPESTADRYLGAHISLARLLKDLGRDEDAKVRFARYEQLGGTEPL